MHHSEQTISLMGRGSIPIRAAEFVLSQIFTPGLRPTQRLVQMVEQKRAGA